MIRTKRNKGSCYYSQGFPCTSIPIQDGMDVTLLKLSMVEGKILEHSLLPAFKAFQRALKTWIHTTRSVKRFLRRQMIGERITKPFRQVLLESYKRRPCGDVSRLEA
jgi:hypothetical protein